MIRSTTKALVGSGVYIIQKSDGLVKIGHTGAPRERLRAISARVGPMSLLAWIPVRRCLLRSSDLLEAALHRRFAPHHVGNEWFVPAPDLLAFVQAVSARGHGDRAAARAVALLFTSKERHLFRTRYFGFDRSRFLRDAHRAMKLAARGLMIDDTTRASP